MSVPSAPPPLLLAAAAVLAVSGLLAWRYSRRRHWVPVGTLSAISLYPLKSGAGLRCQHAQVTAFGLRSGPKLDRCLAVVCNDTILCAMSRRTIVLIKADLDDDSVTLSAPAMTPLRVPLPTEGNSVVHGEQFGTHNAGLDLGEQASKWLSDYFADGKAYTLMYFRHGSVPARRTVDIPRPYARFALPSDVAAFQNVTALSVVCEASVDELNSRMETPVTLDNFRMNLTVAGAAPFADDDWAFVRIGTAVMRHIKAVQRCPNTCVDPRTGQRSQLMEPLRTLRTFRLAKTKEEKAMYKDSPLLGNALGVDVEGDINVGDTVYALMK
ncbi:mitochondrial amidoxime-reducing component 1-like [Amphibalanus amphitrite]|uniref:mitochondrial amidoxime-reducing component 1-like n=1 Tax=Amphibalanus amphitrite TaxID=1232801 RepID=UPI001C917435|nr:mitochondrial amidoxime-reducing component 1-like [Amphibalanus amphitrite]